MANTDLNNTPPVKVSRDKFLNQVVVITGAANGIGRTTAQLFAAQGALVVLIDLPSQEENLKALLTDLKANHSSSSKSTYHTCDLSLEDHVATAITSIIQTHSQIDILAHLAGVYPFSPLTSYPTPSYRQVMTVNVDASFFLVRAILPHMQSRGYGRIILTSSSSTRDPLPGLSMYITSKGAVTGLTRAAAVEAGPGVTVNAVLPGLIKTENVLRLGMKPDGSNAIYEAVEPGQIVKRWGMPEDVAHAICYLGSPEAGFMTGQCLPVDGGASWN